jgi:hypothetical protein
VIDGKCDQLWSSGLLMRSQNFKGKKPKIKMAMTRKDVYSMHKRGMSSTCRTQAPDLHAGSSNTSAPSRTLGIRRKTYLDSLTLTLDMLQVVR